MPLRRDYLQPEYGPDDGSSEAEEAMFLEAMASMRRRQPWRFARTEHDRDGIDRRCFGRDEADNPTREAEVQITW